eukprot:jgi/Botrbrau1/17271/Bobra.0015s0029.1
MSRFRGPALLSRVISWGPGFGLQRAVLASFPMTTVSYSSSSLFRTSLPAILTRLSEEFSPTGFPALLGATFAVRPLFVSVARLQQQEEEGSGRKEERRKDSLTVTEEDINAITDQIPQRPMGVVEGTSYTVVIVAALAFAGAVLWAVVKELIIEPKEYKAFNMALDRLRDDPRVTVRLGTPISGYGQESRNRAARQRIPHRIQVDQNGVEHVQVQFWARGPSGVARVTAELHQDAARQWQFDYLFVEVDAPLPQRVTLIHPQYAPHIP